MRYNRRQRRQHMKTLLNFKGYIISSLGGFVVSCAQLLLLSIFFLSKIRASRRCCFALASLGIIKLLDSSVNFTAGTLDDLVSKIAKASVSAVLLSLSAAGKGDYRIGKNETS